MIFIMKNLVQSAGALKGAEQEEQFYSGILGDWVTKTEFLKNMEGGIHFEAIQKEDFPSKSKGSRFKDDGFIRTGFFDGYWILEPESFKELVKIFKTKNIPKTGIA